MTKKKTTRLAAIVGLNIAARRKAKGWTQAKMAEYYEISSDSLSRMERGFIAPRFSRLEPLAALLDCTVADLFRIPDDLQAESTFSQTDTPCDLTTLDPKHKILEHAERIVFLTKMMNETPNTGAK